LGVLERALYACKPERVVVPFDSRSYPTLMTIVSSILVVALLALGFESAHACSCARQSGALEEQVRSAVASSSGVYLVRVTQVESVKIPRTASGGTWVASDGSTIEIPARTYVLEGAITTFDVIKTWKGPTEATVRTRIVTACCVCGVSFEAGGEYLLYASGPDADGFLSTSRCQRGGLAAGAREEIKLLDAIAGEDRDK
jgi:hypothetical protein